MKTNIAARLLATAVSAALVATPALARQASTLTDINGSRASSAENMLQERGFKYISGNKGNYGSSYTYWWHLGDKNCVMVEVMEAM
jgi:hypothetical protein